MNGDIAKKSVFRKELREIVFTASEADSTDGGDSSHSSSPQPDELGELRPNGSIKKFDRASSSEGSLQIREASNERLDLDFAVYIFMFSCIFHSFMFFSHHFMSTRLMCTFITTAWFYYVTLLLSMPPVWNFDFAGSILMYILCRTDIKKASLLAEFERIFQMCFNNFLNSVERFHSLNDFEDLFWIINQLLLRMFGIDFDFVFFALFFNKTIDRSARSLPHDFSRAVVRRGFRR